MNPVEDLTITKLELDVETIKAFGASRRSVDADDGGTMGMTCSIECGGGGVDCDDNTGCNCDIWWSYMTAYFGCCDE